MGAQSDLRRRLVLLVARDKACISNKGYMYKLRNGCAFAIHANHQSYRIPDTQSRNNGALFFSTSTGGEIVQLHLIRALKFQPVTDGWGTMLFRRSSLRTKLWPAALVVIQSTYGVHDLEDGLLKWVPIRRRLGSGPNQRIRVRKDTTQFSRKCGNAKQHDSHLCSTVST
ncbi:hypothetical protein AB1N83_001946 [Pleurotus pulmonarius]